MITEQEAKTKWCPHAVASHTNPRRGFEGESGVDATFPCLGSGCMAWRWQESAAFKAQADEEYRRTGKRLTNNVGYCGLAGKP